MDFNAWTAKFNKKYNGAEALRRRAIFTMNAKLVATQNKVNGFEMSVDGPFAAMTNAEYRANLKATRVAEEAQANVETLKADYPESLDWRSQGKITPIRDQAQCGSCYTFGSVAALEGRLLMQYSNLDKNTLDLSEEQLVQCSRSLGNNGCNGGLGTKVYKYIQKNGIVREKDMPYTAKDGRCTVDLSKKYAGISGYKNVASKNTEQLKAALTEGVVDVSIDASSYKFQLYKTGVYTDTKCGTSIMDLNHEVACVGYGKENGQEYWIVRNSWGTSWGDKGYIKMAIKGNTCGVSTDPIYPVGVKLF